MSSESIRLMICDVSRELIERSTAFKDAALKSSSDYDKARQFALYEVVSLLVQQADAFGVDRAVIGLADIDPERDIL